MPTYSQGIFMPEMSMSMLRRIELGTIGKLFKFQSD
jgi:hypothetical protein